MTLTVAAKLAVPLLQCKECATSEERRRREERAPLAAEHAKQAKRCTRCRMQKDVEQFCRNSRSFDGRYSQCRTCVANKVGLHYRLCDYSTGRQR